MPTNLIVNGTFDAGSTGWTGSDLETNHTEHAYLGNRSGNRVAELDGHSGKTTVMRQSFVVSGTGEVSATFNIDSALRTASLKNAGSEGFSVKITDASGKVIAAMTILPTTSSWNSFTMDVLFPAPGTYTLEMTEIGKDDSLGAIIDNVEMLVCFCKGTMIDTPAGPRPVQDLKVGDLVRTSSGPRPLRWIGTRRVSAQDMQADETLRPVRIRAGALGLGLPVRDLYVSRQHRMLCRSALAERMFGSPEILIAAIRLCRLPGIRLGKQPHNTVYHHLLLDDHAVIYAEGAPTESLRLTETSGLMLTDAAWDELLRVFPMLAARAGRNGPDAALIPSLARQKAFARRLGRNRKPPLTLSRADGAARLTA
ncbi:Hint domain-containing protein [Thalassovita sp.]|uniref:Hint domain-containing protein n=1 Tax=Thalassovita sp. TaxID=1979401 RepID=UPI0029DE90C5|nr:Hint domain-containing protein [Thalassovita sp.]